MATSGNTAEYVLLNVGALHVPNSSAAEPVLLNVGVLDVPNSSAAESVLLNTVEVSGPSASGWGPEVVAGTTIAARTNGCVNPSFEVDTVGWTNMSGTITRDTSTAYVGSACLRTPVLTTSILPFAYGFNS